MIQLKGDDTLKVSEYEMQALSKPCDLSQNPIKIELKKGYIYLYYR